MMSLEMIRERNRKAGHEARDRGVRPVCIEVGSDIDTYPPFPFPDMGEFCPGTYVEVDRWFCDATGMGSDDEPALSPEQVKAKLRETFVHHPEYSYAVVEAGQFQVYLGVFRRATPEELEAAEPFALSPRELQTRLGLSFEAMVEAANRQAANDALPKWTTCSAGCTVQHIDDLCPHGHRSVVAAIRPPEPEADAGADELADVLQMLGIDPSGLQLGM